jgi:hypothetical protein
MFTSLACECLGAEELLSHGKTPSGKSKKGTNKQTMINMPISKGMNCVEFECLAAVFLGRRRLLISVMVILMKRIPILQPVNPIE